MVTVDVAGNVILYAVKLVTIPVYIVFLITLWRCRRHEKLSSAFFKLLFSTGIVDVALMVSSLLTSALAGFGWIPDVYIYLGDFAARLSNICTFSFGVSQTFGTTMIAVNRFTAYVMPLQHKSIWHGKRTVLYVIAAQWALMTAVGVPLCIPSIFQFRVWPVANSSAVLLQWTYPEQSTFYTLLIVFGLDVPMAALMFILYGTIFGTAIFRLFSAKQPMGVVEKAALKMAIAGFFASFGCFIWLGILIIQKYLYIFWRANLFSDANQPYFWLIFNLGGTLVAAAGPYAMFVFSGAVRDECLVTVRAIVGLGRKVNGGSSASVEAAATKSNFSQAATPVVIVRTSQGSLPQKY